MRFKQTPTIRRLMAILWLVALSCLAAAAPSGKEQYDEIVKTTPILKNPDLATYVDQLGQTLARQTGLSTKFTFTVLDSPDINAFAIADGYIFVYRGILNLLETEEQLAAVLAHEIGHVAGNHISKTNSKATGGQLLAVLAAVLSGSSEVYEAGTLWANSLVSGYGRKMELEADQLGAGYMYKAGYNPQGVIEALTRLKDYEELQKAQAKEKGKSRRSYHGLFASHPRNDARLRSVVSRADKLKDSAGYRDPGREIYRQHTDGLIWDENFAAKEQPATRYNDMSLKVRFDFPEEWQFKATPPDVSGSPASGGATLSMKPQRRTLQSPEEFMHNQLGVGLVTQGREISPARLKGYSAIIPGEDGKADSRIAVVYYKLNAYVFRGTVKDSKKFEEFDQHFAKSIDSFRPISQREIEGQKPRYVKYVKATEATTFDRLGRDLGLDKFETQEMRLINGYYPRGEPKPGEWIKIIRQ